MTYHYRAHGLTVASEFELPHAKAVGEKRPEVTFRSGEVPAVPTGAHEVGAFCHIHDRKVFLTVPGVARYLVSGGDQVVVEPEDGTDTASVAAFLLSSCWGALLHQRQELPLHASVVTPDGVTAVAFAGSSGSGKSTLASEMLRRGWSLLTDDIAAVSLADDLPQVSPASVASKLWVDALERFGIEPFEHMRLRPQLDKYVVRREGQVCLHPCRLVAVFVLRAHNRPEVELSEKLAGAKRFAVLDLQTFRRRMVAPLGERAGHFGRLAAVSALVPVRSAGRPSIGDHVSDLADAVEVSFERQST